MTKQIKIIDQDIVFLSYDEPNAEKNYADLCSKIPWAKRVHGVKGSDAAHKACAAKSETEYFVTVDADNIVDTAFFQQVIDLDALGLTEDNVFSWCGKIHVNGLMYGNGGLKLWTRKFVNEMRTHENSNPDDTKGAVEFCFDPRYRQFNENFSTSYTNATPFQSWRAGFREGVKMSLNEGKKADDIKQIWWQNYQRLLVWCNIGLDVTNGIWSMLGAREGCYLTNCTDWDYTNVRDFEYLTSHWEEKYGEDYEPEPYYKWLGDKLKAELDLEISNVDSLGSVFFKQCFSNVDRIRRRSK